MTDLDVAIVGAGVSGVYAGWRLRTDSDSSPPSVQVFEQSRRIGGRLLSVEAPELPGVMCELGGMRYMSTQKRVRALVEDVLELRTAPFSVGEPENLNYMRGRQFRSSQLIADAQIPYDLDWAERGVAVDVLINNVLDGLIPGVTKLSGDALHKLLRTFKIDGRHIHEWGFWNLLARGMTHEAYELARVSGGYDTPLLNWNAYDTISLNFELSPGVTFSSLPGGYHQVPSRLAELFQQAGGTINLGQRLVSFTAKAGGVELQFVGEDGKSQTLTAGKLILAMPRRSLELIGSAAELVDPALLEAVTPIPLFKMFVVYEFPWWETVGVTQGRSVTDLPVRQCYYWASGPPRDNDPDNRRSVLLASYDDGLSVDFWQGLAGPGPLRAPQSENWDDYTPPEAMVAEVDRQLREMHGVRYAPPPVAAAYMDWGVDPFGGGVNFWNIYAKSWEVIPAIVQPDGQRPVYICGEAYSNGQGWVEGALETAELVLAKLGLAPPEWLA